MKEVLARYLRYARIIVGYASVRLALFRLRRRGLHPLIAIGRPAGIGDIIATFPAIAQLRLQNPRAAIVYVTSAAFIPVVRLSGVADLVIEHAWQGRFPKYRPTDYDQVLWPRTEDEKPTGQPHVHLVDDFARKMNLSAGDGQPRLHVPARLQRSSSRLVARFNRSRSGPLIALHPGPSWAVRMWTADGWDKLATRLREELGATLVQIGADFHSELGETEARPIAEAVNLVGQLSLEGTIGLIEQCDLLIGIDSGMLHIAGAVGTPSVGVFGPVDPTLRLPKVTRSLGSSRRRSALYWLSSFYPHSPLAKRLSSRYRLHADVER